MNNMFLYDQLIKLDEAIADKLIYQIDKKLKFIGSVKPFGDYVHEAKIKFPPTYKFIHKGCSYLLNSSYVPCYTDRVFWLNGKDRDKWTVESKSYECCYSVNCSDHKPVYAQFVVQRQEKSMKEHKTPTKQIVIEEPMELSDFGEKRLF